MSSSILHFFFHPKFATRMRAHSNHLCWNENVAETQVLRLSNIDVWEMHHKQNISTYYPVQRASGTNWAAVYLYLYKPSNQCCEPVLSFLPNPYKSLNYVWFFSVCTYLKDVASLWVILHFFLIFWAQSADVIAFVVLSVAVWHSLTWCLHFSSQVPSTQLRLFLKWLWSLDNCCIKKRKKKSFVREIFHQIATHVSPIIRHLHWDHPSCFLPRRLGKVWYFKHQKPVFIFDQSAVK